MVKIKEEELGIIEVDENEDKLENGWSEEELKQDDALPQLMFNLKF